MDLQVGNNESLELISLKKQKEKRKTIPYIKVKRIVDSIFAIFLLLIFAIPMLIVAICIKIEDGRTNNIQIKTNRERLKRILHI